jgi:hypothetical protein
MNLSALALLAVVALTAPGQDPVRVWATLSPNSIAQGETAILELNLETRGGKPEQISIPDLPPELEIIRTNDYTHLQFSLPGGRSRIIRREIVLRARAPGTFRIQPITAQVQGARYQTDELILTVTDQGRAGSPGAGAGPGAGSGRSGALRPFLDDHGSFARGPRDEVLLRARLAPDTAYVGQQVMLRSQTWVSEEAQLRLRRAPEYHPPNSPGFWTHDLPGPVQGGRQLFDERFYRVQEFQRAYFPLIPGEYTLPPARLVYEVRRSFLYATDDQDLATDSLRLVVLPFPQEGRTTHFAGAVGRFSIRARLEPAAVPAGEATALVVEIEGSGNIKALPPPLVPALDGVDFHPPGEDAEIRVRQGLITGTKRFTWVLVPREPGRHQIPALEYHYFDPELRQYQVARTDPLALVVNPGEAGSPTPSTNETIRELKPQPAGESPLAWIRSPFFALIFAAPLLALAPLGRRRRRQSGKGAPPAPSARKLRRQRSAALLDLRQQATAAGDDLFYALAALIRTEIALMTGAAAPARGHARSLAALLEAHGLPHATASAVGNLLGRIEGARYQPTPPGPAARLAFVEETEQILTILDRHSTRSGWTSPGSTAGILLLLIPLACANCSGATNLYTAAKTLAGGRAAQRVETLPVAREGDFQRAVEHIRNGDFDAAAHGFTEFLRDHPRDPYGWYNLGNAQFHAGRRGPALWAWLHALRLAPRDHDTRHNLRLAAADPALIRAVTYRLPLSSEELFLLAGLAWLAGAAGLIGYSSTRRPAAARAGALAITLALGALAIRLAPTLGPAAAVALPDQIPLRIAPDHRAETIHLLDGGAYLRILERRGEWLRISTAPGAEGWVEDRLVGQF